MGSAAMNAGRRQWAHDYISDHLADIAETFPGFPNVTVLIRDPEDREMYIVITNETDATAVAMVDATYATDSPAESAEP